MEGQRERGHTSGSHDPIISVLSTSNSLDCPDPLLDTIRPFRRTLAPASSLLSACPFFCWFHHPRLRLCPSPEESRSKEDGEEE